MVDYVSKTANQQFWAMLNSAHRKGEGSSTMLDHTLIGIDPGETTGFGFRPVGVNKFELFMTQIDTKDRNAGANEIACQIEAITKVWGGKNPLIICEDYRVYGHKSDQHKWAGLHTPKLIGHLEHIAWQMGIPFVTPMAIEGKSFATDENLKLWGLYDPGMKHARDASRHIVTKAFFGSPISLDS